MNSNTCNLGFFPLCLLTDLRTTQSTSNICVYLLNKRCSCRVPHSVLYVITCYNTIAVFSACHTAMASPRRIRLYKLIPIIAGGITMMQNGANPRRPLDSRHVRRLTSWRCIIMRLSSLGGGRILRRTLSVCPSVPLSLPRVTWRHLANYNDTRAEGRISYGHLGRTNLLLLLLNHYALMPVIQNVISVFHSLFHSWGQATLRATVDRTPFRQYLYVIRNFRHHDAWRRNSDLS